MIRMAIFIGNMIVVHFVFSTCTQQPGFPVLIGLYLGQKPPGMTLEIFAPGIVSLKDAKELGGCTFSPDGNFIFFT